MKVKRETPRTEMVYASILDKMREFFEPLCQELGLSPTAVDEQLTQYAALSARVEFKKGEVDFELAEIILSPDEIKTRFIRYIDTEKYDVVETAMVEIARAKMAAVAAIHGPDPLPETSPKP